MSTFVVYEDATGNAKAIKQGPNLIAFLFTVPWLIVKGLWLQVLVWFVGFVLIAGPVNLVAGEHIQGGEGLGSLFYLLGMSVFVSIKASKWMEKDLINRGWKRRGTADGKTAEAAQNIYINWRKASEEMQRKSHRV